MLCLLSGIIALLKCQRQSSISVANLTSNLKWASVGLCVSGEKVLERLLREVTHCELMRHAAGEMQGNER